MISISYFCDVLNCSQLEESLSKFHPDIIVYNAGTDILAGDPLGKLDISPEVCF